MRGLSRLMAWAISRRLRSPRVPALKLVTFLPPVPPVVHFHEAVDDSPENNQ
jgi:hypothetical protein